MRKIPLALIALLTLSPKSALDAQTPPSVPPPTVTLTASMERLVCPEGQPVVLAMALHNNRAENLIAGGWSEASSFQITVTDGAGRAVPHTADGDRVLTPAMQGSASSVGDFRPGQTIWYRFNLARLFDLSRSGDYTVSVSRRLRPWVRPRPAAVTPPPEIALSAGPLKIHMVEDPAAKSGPTVLAPPTHQSFLYMTDQRGNGVGRYRVGADGDVSFAFPPAYPAPIPPVTPPAKEGFHSITATPDGHFLYVGNSVDSTVSQFRVGDDGVLLPLSPPTVPAHHFPGYPAPLLMDPKGRYLYNLTGTLYAIGPDGRLTVTASVSNGPPVKNNDPLITRHDYNVTASATGAINAAGTCLYTSLGLTRGYRIATDGALTALPLPVGLESEAGRANDMAIALSPSGKFAFVGTSTTLSNAFFDKVVPMRVAPDGTLSALPGVIIPKGPPPKWPGYILPDCVGLAVDPSGHFLVVVNPQYLACYRIEADGSLSPLEAKPTGAGFGPVLFGPGGHILYAVDRYADTFTAFRLDDRLGLVPAGVNLPDGLLSADCIASAVAPTSLKWGQAAGGLALSARLTGDALPAGAPAILMVILRNTTSHPIRLGAASADMISFRLSLVGPPRKSPGSLSGPGEPAVEAVPLLAAGHDLLDAPTASGAALVLPPGGERRYRFALSRLADLTVAGFYTIQVSRVLPGGLTAASPVLHVLLEGPYNGITRVGNGAELDVL